jgi:predicted CXXCH cytochrome family protein
MTSTENTIMPGDSTNTPEEIFAITDVRGSLHYPFGEGECASCHNEQSLGNMIEPQPALCYLCHVDLSESYNYLHGPVAGGYCSACHDPHRSTNEKLLRYAGDELCFYCHRLKASEAMKCTRIWKACYAPIVTIPTGGMINIFFNSTGLI